MDNSQYAKVRSAAIRESSQAIRRPTVNAHASAARAHDMARLYAVSLGMLRDASWHSHESVFHAHYANALSVNAARFKG